MRLPPDGDPCPSCLGRSWLRARLASHIEPVRSRIDEILALDDDELIESVGGPHRERVHSELERFDADQARDDVAAAGLQAVCRCDARYPVSLASLPAPPPVIYVAGGLDRFLDLTHGDTVAIVGARRASAYGLEVARSLGRGVGLAGVAVISGMAFGIDAAAHAGALSAGGTTIAVLPGSAAKPYPAAKRSLHQKIRDRGAVVSEMPPCTNVWRWLFPARNRIIAALATLTIVVEARERSGSLLTASVARRLGRHVAAVPGPVTSKLAAGPNGLLAAGAHLVQGPQDVLDLLFGAGSRTVPDARPELERTSRALLDALADGSPLPAAIESARLSLDEGLAALASLELAGYLRRGPGGSFAVVP